MYSKDYIFRGPAELYVDKVKVGWTKGGLRLRTARSMWFRPSMLGLGHDEAVTQMEEYFVSTVLSESTFENLRIAWGFEEPILDNTGNLGNKVMHFGGNNAIPIRTVKFRSIDRKMTMVFYKAVAVDFGDINHGKVEEITIPVTFKMMLDTTKAIGAQIGYMMYGPSAYETELVCRLTVREKKKFLQSRLTVRKKTTKSLVARYTTLKPTSKSLVMRLTSKPRKTKALVSRVTVT